MLTARSAGAVRIIRIALLLNALAVWYRSLGTVSVDTINSPRAELFYWVTIMFSQTLGTALGDWTADSAGLGYSGGAIVFAAFLALVVPAYYGTSISCTSLFWLHLFSRALSVRWSAIFLTNRLMREGLH